MEEFKEGDLVKKSSKYGKAASNTKVMEYVHYDEKVGQHSVRSLNNKDYVVYWKYVSRVEPLRYIKQYSEILSILLEEEYVPGIYCGGSGWKKPDEDFVFYNESFSEYAEVPGRYEGWPDSFIDERVDGRNVR